MTLFLNRDSNTITISTFWENHQLDKYDFNPAYQRRSVWTEEKHSYFIDSLLKNFPVPPIFLRQNINPETGRSKYEIIDGKQRLTAIVKFINNEIPVTNEFPVAELDDDDILGLYFSNLDNEIKKRFWSYALPIEYIDTTNNSIVENIFDRLNRNGEPLKGQELRNAKYHATDLLQFITRMADHQFWVTRLNEVDKSRMEDVEFVSEIVFVLLESSPQHATQELLDSMYETYGKLQINYTQLENEFNLITDFLENLNLDFNDLKISGVSHLYGLWCFSWYCINNDIRVDSVRDKIREFYHNLRSTTTLTEYHQIYRTSMSARTKDKNQRKRRMEALIKSAVN